MIRHPTLNSDHYDLNREEYGSRRWANGAYKGIVRIVDDDKKFGRVKVRVPQLHGMDVNIISDEALPWAYPIAPLAGAGTGSLTIPAPDTKVWVLFEQGDINHPLWFGGWLTDSNPHPDDPPNPAAPKANNAAQKASDAAKGVAQAAQAAQAASHSATAAASAAQGAASSVQSAAQNAANAVDSLATNPLAVAPSDLQSAQVALSSAQAAATNVANSVGSKASDATDAAIAAQAASIQAGNALSSTFNSVQGDLSVVVNAGRGSTDINLQITSSVGNSLLSTYSDLASQALSVNGLTANVSNYVNGVSSSINSLSNTAQSVISVVQGAINAVTGGYSSVDNLLSTMSNLTNIAQSVLGTASSMLDSIFGGGAAAAAIAAASAAATKAANAASALAKANDSITLEKVSKLVGKRIPDPAAGPARPYLFNNKPWPIGPGSELAHEAQNMANDVPSVNMWQKSSKGHTQMCDDQDAKESMTFIDRAGNALYFTCPVHTEYNTSNKMFRRQGSTLTGDAIDRKFMRDRGSKIGLQDQAQSRIELDSRDGAAKIVIVANDGLGGIENGLDRQRMEFMADAKTITIESVKSGEVLAKVHIDANSGVIVLESARFLTMRSPYISIDSDHINLNGRCNIAGDLTVSGRITGGNK